MLRTVFVLIQAGLAFVLGGASQARADYTSTNLPDWAIGPFERYAGNPVLSPQGSTTPIPGGFESGNVFNPGVIVRTDPNTHAANTFEMLYRAQNCQAAGACGAGGTSVIAYATSMDGHTFARYAGNPVISTSSVPNAGCGIEDPRLYELNGVYYTFFTAVHAPCGNGFDLNEAYSTDLIHWTQVGVVELGTKDGLIVADPNGTPVQINGQYVLYYGQDNPGTNVAYSSDMIHWHHASDLTPQTGDPVDMHFPAAYSSWEMAYAVTDYPSMKGEKKGGKINHDILIFVAGNLTANGRWFYAAGEVLFSRTNLTQQLYQLTDAVLSPMASYERVSPASKNAIWLNSLFFYQNQWWMFYGAGDHVVALANAPLREHSWSPPAGAAFFTSFDNGQRLPDWVDFAEGGGGITNVGPFPRAASGPEAGIRQEIAHSGISALMYSGSPRNQSDNYAYMKLFDVSGDAITVSATTTLSYWIYPQNTAGTCVALDLQFSDGTALRNLSAHDEKGTLFHPTSQCNTLIVNQWNLVKVNIGNSNALGKQITRIDVGYDQPNGMTPYRGYIDDISILKP